MGAGKSTRSESQKETVIVQKRLKSDEEIESIFDDFPRIDEMRFTKTRFDYLHYIVFVHNHKLFESCLDCPRVMKVLLKSTLSNGDKLIHTAINNHNELAVESILKVSNHEEKLAKNCNGIDAYSLAKLRENHCIISLFNTVEPAQVSAPPALQEESKLNVTSHTHGSKIPLKGPLPRFSKSKVCDESIGVQTVQEKDGFISNDHEELKKMTLQLERAIQKQIEFESRGATPSNLGSQTDNLSKILPQNSNSALL
ncbi:unnamed protein product [Moneuplotes crassus]|uniref:Uncharacterized protein n=1 Tax=Euplotes crassus TaxID=5936 RepID=A0AAD1XS28_EUPCR|nr:unnamed protein product [Moneuplotes crassus]